MCRMEVYPDIGTGGSSIKIFSQMHIHYEAELEYMPLERPYSYLPYDPSLVEPAIDSKGLSTQFQDGTVGHAEGRVIGRVAGPSDNDALWV